MAQGQATKVKKKEEVRFEAAAQAGQRAEVNRANRTRVRTLIKRLRTAISAGGCGRGRNFATADAVGRLTWPSARRVAREYREIGTSRVLPWRLM